MTSSLDPTIRHGALIALGRTCKAVKAHSEVPLEQRLSAETLLVIGLCSFSLKRRVNQKQNRVLALLLTGFF
jgi:hypothetical protein